MASCYWPPPAPPGNVADVASAFDVRILRQGMATTNIVRTSDLAHGAAGGIPSTTLADAMQRLPPGSPCHSPCHRPYPWLGLSPLGSGISMIPNLIKMPRSTFAENYLDSYSRSYYYTTRSAPYALRCLRPWVGVSGTAVITASYGCGAGV